MAFHRYLVLGIATVAIIVGASISGKASALSARDLNAKADAALALLQRTEPVTEKMIKNAKGIMIFPEIVKGGFVLGASTGKGVLRANGKTEGYYRSSAVSYGLQAGVAKFGYVMFLMDDAALRHVRNTRGWEVGVGPNVIVADEGFTRKVSTTTLDSGIYVFFIDQAGLFAGAGIEGTKISQIEE